MWTGTNTKTGEKTYYTSVYNKISKTTNIQTFMKAVQKINTLQVWSQPKYTEDYITITDLDTHKHSLVIHKHKNKQLSKSKTTEFINSYSQYILQNKDLYFYKLKEYNNKLKIAKTAEKTARRFKYAQRVYDNLSLYELIQLENIIIGELDLYNSFQM